LKVKIEITIVPEPELVTSDFFKANPTRTASLRCCDLAIRAQAVMGMYTPMVATIHARNGWVRFHVDEHRFGAQQAALILHSTLLRSRFGHN
jgi:hypothetical protein